MAQGKVSKHTWFVAFLVGTWMVWLALSAWPEAFVDEDLRHDPTLPRAEQLRRHRLRLKKILEEHRQKAAELQKQREEQNKSALQAQRDALRAKIEQARKTASTGRVTLTAPRSVTRTPIRTSRTGRIASSAAPPPPPGKKVAFPTSRAIIYLSPFQSLVEVGSQFETRVQLLNSSGMPFDQVTLHLQYDPMVLAPLEVNDAPIHDQVDGEPTLNVNGSRGWLRYYARLRAPIRETSVTLATVRWLALNPILYSEIGFVSNEGKTRIGKAGGNILGYDAGGVQEGGTLPAGVVVMPRDASPRTLMPPLADVALAGIDERVNLRLEADPETVGAGEEWIVSLVLRNDAALPFNDLSVRIFFDPAKLEVEDWHTGNWIRQGINIYDGFAHETYPFDVYRANRADNEKGEILYHVGTQDAKFFPSGELARIKFRARADASLADVHFDFEVPQQAGGELMTDVKLFGSSVFYERRASTARESRPAPEPLRRPGT